jgi:hypothetical protein
MNSFLFLQLRSNTYDLDFIREYATYSSKQFDEHQPIEQTLPYDPTRLSLHNVKSISSS